MIRHFSVPLGSMVFLFLLLARLPGSARADSPNQAEWLERPGGDRVPGRVKGNVESGFRFEAARDQRGMFFEAGSIVEFAGRGPDSAAGFPPFRLELGLEQRLSGRLNVIDGRRIQLGDGPGGQTVTVARPGVLAVVQRPGEVQILQDGFESLDPVRWAQIGEPQVVDSPTESGAHSLRIPAGATAVTCTLPEPVASGRLEAAFYDSGDVVPGHQWFVDLLFRTPAGSETVRAVLGWSEESLAVESPGGPAMAVQRLAHRRGWHRLSLRFGPDQTKVAVDGNELAHGRGVSRPLAEIRIASFTSGKASPPPGLAGYVDDLRLARLAEPVGGLEVDIMQDEARLASGSQVFGSVSRADGERVVLTAGDRDVALPWSDVSGLYFRRVATPGKPVEGLLVRLEWRAAPGNDPHDLDQAEGALAAASDTALGLDTAYSGRLTVPRDRLRRMRVLGRGWRLVIDPTVHHLGNDIAAKDPALDPPFPEGATLERTFELEKVPQGAAFLTLDVVQVVGEAEGLQFSHLVRKGELRTNVSVNGQYIDYLNHHITGKNETPERIRLPIGAGLLRPGKNGLRIEQVGIASDSNFLDDLGLLGIALEFAEVDPRAGVQPGPP